MGTSLTEDVQVRNGNFVLQTAHAPAAVNTQLMSPALLDFHILFKLYDRYLVCLSSENIFSDALQLQLAECVADPQCFENLACLQLCNGRKDEAGCQVSIQQPATLLVPSEAKLDAISR